MKQDKRSRSERNALEHRVHPPEAAAWRSNAAWLAWPAVQLEVLAQSANHCFPAMGLGHTLLEKQDPQIIVKHYVRESPTMIAKARHGMIRAGTHTSCGECTRY